MKKYKRVYLEITNICNLNCSFCPKTSREKRYMNIEEFEFIINQIKGYTNYVNLHVMGEPTMHKDLKVFLDIAGKNNLKVNITTNGILLDGEVADTLLKSDSLNKISVSLHSFEANETNFTLDEYLQKIAVFAKKASETNKIITALRLWNLDFGGVKGQNSLNDKIVSVLEQNFDVKISLEDMIKTNKDFKLAQKTFLQLANKFEWPDISKDMDNEKVFCYGLRNQFAILVDGTVVPCCLDNQGQINLGNIFKTSLKDILNSERAKNIYEGFSNRKAVEDLCKRCQYAQRF